MVYLLIALALALIVGPIVWVRPTREENRLAGLRAHARAQGFQMDAVRLASDPVYAPWLQRNPHLPSVGWMRYQLAPEDARVRAAMTWKQRRDKSGRLVWEEWPIGQGAPEGLNSLLADWDARQDARWLALECTEYSVAIIWNEQGSAADVDTCAAHIRRYFEEG